MLRNYRGIKNYIFKAYASTFCWPKRMRKPVELIRILFLLYPKYIYKYLYENKIKSKYVYISKKDINGRYVVYSFTGEGIGAQIGRFKTAKFIAKKFNLTYLHRPFNSSWHSPECDWENFLGFGKIEKKFQEVKSLTGIKNIFLPEFNTEHYRQVQILLISKIIQDIYPYKGVIFHLTGFSYIPYWNNPGLFNLINSKLKSQYWNSRKISPIKHSFGNNFLKIAVHIRRGDIENDKFFWRKIEIPWYFIIVQRIIKEASDCNIKICVYSDTRSSDIFKYFENLPNTSIFCDPSRAIQAFHDMVVSDILVCSVSSFSVEAGYLSEGVKIIHPYLVELTGNWDDTNKDWVKSDKSGNFDIGRVIEKISAKSIHGK